MCGRQQSKRPDRRSVSVVRMSPATVYDNIIELRAQSIVIRNACRKNICNHIEKIKKKWIMKNKKLRIGHRVIVVFLFLYLFLDRNQRETEIIGRTDTNVYRTWELIYYLYYLRVSYLSSLRYSFFFYE